MYVYLVLGVMFILLYISKNNKIKRIKDLTSSIPGPKVYPIIGNGLIMTTYKGGMLKYLEAAQKKYGKIMRHWIGPNLYVHLSDPLDVEILLRDTKNLKKSTTYSFIKPWLGEGLITSTGLHWHSHRKVLTPTFHFNILDDFVKVFNEKGKILIKLLSEQCGKEMFDVFPYINMYALDAILETAMGVPSNTQERFNQEYVKAIHKVTKVVQTRSYNILMRWNFCFQLSQLSRDLKDSLKIIHGQCDKIIEQRKKEIEQENEHAINVDDTGVKKREAFLTLLLKSQRSGSGFTDQDIQDEVNSFIFGGHDTTSAAIAFALYHLSKNHEIQQKTYEEIIDLFGESDVELNMQDLQRTKYLDQVVKEVLRLSPPIPVVSRELEHDLKLTSTTLPKGCAASVLIYMLHRNPEYFPDPDKFDPDRFSPENIAKKNPYAFVPFSAGPRNCIGQKYAQLEIKVTLIKILKHFKILPGEKVKETISMVLKAENGIKIKLIKRG